MDVGIIVSIILVSPCITVALSIVYVGMTVGITLVSDCLTVAFSIV